MTEFQEEYALAAMQDGFVTVPQIMAISEVFKVG